MILRKTKAFAKTYLPVGITSFLSSIFYGWYGNYSSWDEAKNLCTGYDSDEIIDKVKSAALKVRDKINPYERDSVIFDTIQYSFPVLSGLMWIAARNNGKINVLDFGGALGSTFFQNRKFLETIKEVNWCIVEQPKFVKIGRESFESDNLHFFYDVDECLKFCPIDAILLSSVLQYLEEPYVFLEKLFLSQIEYIIIDRTPFIKHNDRISIQKVNPAIYNGSYPCWFFNEKKFISLISSLYELIFEFNALDKANIRSEFKGFVFRKK